MTSLRVIPTPLDFQWDTGNRNKNFLKHHVTDEECEEVFFDPFKRLFDDPVHSNQEKRHILLGQTKGERILFIAFTIRQKKIRVISARDLNRKECQLYEKTIQRPKI
jgi:uncharacterized DUF497 family protein